MRGLCLVPLLRILLVCDGLTEKKSKNLPTCGENKISVHKIVTPRARARKANDVLCVMRGNDHPREWVEDHDHDVPLLMAALRLALR